MHLKQLCDQPADRRPTKQWLIESRSTRLKIIPAEFESSMDYKCQVIRTSLFHKLEKAVNKCFNIVHEKKVEVSGPMVHEKALGYAK